MTLIIIALLLLAILVWLLFSPIRLKIDTRESAYLCSWLGIGRVQLLPVTDDLVIQLQIWFWKKNFYPLRPNPQKEKPKETRKKKKKRKMNFQKYKRKGLRLVRSFRVKAFRLNLDTDDYLQNSYLYPFFHLLSNNNRQLTINYRGETELLLIVENRVARMLIAFLF